MLKGKVVLITGASSGIGRAVAIRFANEGASVILVDKSVPALEKVDDEIHKLGHKQAATLVELDLTDFSKYEQLSLAILNKFGKLDILIGNAAKLTSLSPIQDYTSEQWNSVIDVNLNANWHLIKYMDSLLKLSDAGRIILSSCSLFKKSNKFWGPYAVSKIALQAMVSIYANELSNSSIKINMIDPGPVDTRLYHRAMPGVDKRTLRKPWEITDHFLKLSLPTCDHSGAVYNLDGSVNNGNEVFSL